MKQKVNISSIKPGNRYNSPIYDKKENLLLPSFHSIHLQYIEEWAQEGDFVYISGELIESENSNFGQELPGYIDKETRLLLQTYYESIQLLKILYQKISTLTLSQIYKITAPWISYALLRSNLSILLKVCRYSLVEPEDYIYYHSIDTMILSLGIYKQYYNEVGSNELNKIAAAALLSDVGMFLLPQDLVKTHEIYSEEEKKEIQKHTLLGYSFLLTKLEFPYEIALAALQHHERPDGSGYPYGYSIKKIHPNSVIIALADTFSSQIHTRYFKESREPVEILKDFVQTMMPIFPNEQHSFISAFVTFTTIYPVTSILELSSGEIVIVTQTTPRYPTRPRVMVLMTSDKRKNSSVTEIDLSSVENQDIMITGTYTQNMLNEIDIYN